MKQQNRHSAALGRRTIKFKSAQTFKPDKVMAFTIAISHGCNMNFHHVIGKKVLKFDL